MNLLENKDTGVGVIYLNTHTQKTEVPETFSRYVIHIPFLAYSFAADVALSLQTEIH